MKTLGLTLLLGACLLGCGAGALGQSRTGDNCSPTDQDCVMAGLGAPLAVGATTRPAVRTQLRGSGAPSLSLWSAAPDVIAVEDGRITGKRDGVSALVMSMDDGSAIDFVHVWVRAADRIELHRIATDGADLGEIDDTIELVAGESLRIAPEPYADAQRLLGAGPSEWRVEPALCDVLRDGAPARRRLVARSPGQATLTVSSLGVSAKLTLVVHPIDPGHEEATP
jgi:hypothetical protein